MAEEVPCSGVLNSEPARGKHDSGNNKFPTVEIILTVIPLGVNIGGIWLGCNRLAVKDTGDGKVRTGSRY